MCRLRPVRGRRTAASAQGAGQAHDWEYVSDSHFQILLLLIKGTVFHDRRAFRDAAASPSGMVRAVNFPDHATFNGESKYARFWIVSSSWRWQGQTTWPTPLCRAVGHDGPLPFSDPFCRFANTGFQMFGRRSTHGSLCILNSFKCKCVTTCRYKRQQGRDDQRKFHNFVLVQFVGERFSDTAYRKIGKSGSGNSQDDPGPVNLKPEGKRGSDVDRMHLSGSKSCIRRNEEAERQDRDAEPA